MVDDEKENREKEEYREEDRLRVRRGSGPKNAGVDQGSLRSGGGLSHLTAQRLRGREGWRCHSSRVEGSYSLRDYGFCWTSPKFCPRLRGRIGIQVTVLDREIQSSGGNTNSHAPRVSIWVSATSSWARNGQSASPIVDGNHPIAWRACRTHRVSRASLGAGICGTVKSSPHQTLISRIVFQEAQI